MTLDDYIISHGTSEAKLAEKAGCSQATISKLRRGVGNPTIGMVLKVSAATNGRVTADEIIAFKKRLDHKRRIAGRKVKRRSRG